MDALQELMKVIGGGATPAGAGEQMAPIVDPAIQKLQQLIMGLFGGGQDLKEGMGGLVNDPISGGPMSQSPLRQKLTRGRLPGSSGQDPSMGMGY